MAGSTIFVVLLFFCHLSALGTYGAGLLAIELFWLWSRRKQPLSAHVAELAAAAIPFVAVIPLFLRSPTLHLLYDYAWEPRGKLGKSLCDI